MFFSPFLSLVRRRPWRSAAVIAVVLVVGSAWYLSRPPAPQYETATARRGNLIQIVSVTGHVKPASSVNLAFEKGGRVAAVYAAVGDRVSVGRLLVTLENGDVAAQLKSEQAKLNELKTGSRPEDLNIEKVKVANAQVALKDAQNNVVDKVNDALTKSDDAIHNKVDQFMSNTQSPSPSINFSVNDSQLKRDIETERVIVEQTLLSWKASLAGLAAESDLGAYISKAKKNLDQIKSFLDKIALAVNALTASTSFSQATIDGYRSDVLTARTNVNTAISNITSADEKLRNAQSDLNLENEELALLLAGTRPEQIAAQEAVVDNYRAQLAKTVIRAPLSGIITRQDAKVGEIAGADSIVVSLISESNFEMETNVPEADIAKAAVGNHADVTLDAYGSGVFFNATVSKIDPAETVIEGVATYKTTLQFDAKDSRIKSGMTANIDIVTAQRQNVLHVPQRAVITKDGKKIVRVLSGGTIREAPVKIGITGTEGDIEITGGLQENDVVITFIK